MILNFVMICQNSDPELRDELSELYQRHLSADMMGSRRFTILNSAKDYQSFMKVGLMSS